MPNVLAELRALCPDRPLTITESLRIADLQAGRLLLLLKIQGPPVPETVIAELPRIQVNRLSPLPFAGASRWKAGLWQIIINGSDPHVRQRFTLGHEFKHILDDAFDKKIYPACGWMDVHSRTKQICDAFSAALLMPKLWVVRLWTTGVQDIRILARRFGGLLYECNGECPSGLSQVPFARTRGSSSVNRDTCDTPPSCKVRSHLTFPHPSL